MPGGTQTPEGFADICESVRQGLIEVITDTLIPAGPPVEGEALPRIWDRLIVDADASTWAAKLESDRHKEIDEGGDEGPQEILKVHAVMVGIGGLETYQEPTIGHAPFRLRFTLDAYYEDETGVTGNNPEKWQAREIAMMAWAILSSRNVRRPGLVHRIYAFRERRGLRPMGERRVRQSLGEVYIDLQPVSLTRPPV